MQLTGVNMSASPRYFNFKAVATAVVGGAKTKVTLALQPCSLSQFSNHGQSIIDSYTRANLSQWLCPVPNQTISLQGKYTSNIFKYIKISVSQCTGADCYDSATIAAFQAANDYFTLSYYYVSMNVQLSEEVPISYYL